MTSGAQLIRYAARESRNRAYERPVFSVDTWATIRCAGLQRLPLQNCR